MREDDGPSELFKRRRDGSPSANELPAKKQKSIGPQFQADVSAALSRLAATNIAVDDLFNPVMVWKIAFPSPYSVPERFASGDYFEFMGRERLQPLLDLMRTLLSGSRIPCRYRGVDPQGETKKLNVYGTRGFGKSFMLAAAVALLLKEGQRVVFVPNARDIVDDPTVCLRASFAMAFPELIDDIALCDRVEDL
eukprot:Opistho-2@92530